MMFYCNERGFLVLCLSLLNALHRGLDIGCLNPSDGHT